jgi:hypothetical protein
MEVLLSMGFSTHQAEIALKQCDGNIDRAIDYLLGSAGTSHKEVLPSNYWPAKH